MKWDQAPAIVFSIALALFAVVYAISTFGAWRSALEWIRDYQDLIAGTMQLGAASLAAVLIWRQLGEARLQSAAAAYPVLDARKRDYVDRLDAINDLIKSIVVLDDAIKKGLACHGANVAVDLIAQFNGCNDDLTALRQITTRAPLGETKKNEIVFAQTCLSYLSICAQFVAGGRVNFFQDEPEIGKKLKGLLDDTFSSVIQRATQSLQSLRTDISRIDSLLASIDRQFSPNEQ